METGPWTAMVEYVRIGLWIANLVIYGCVIGLYLRRDSGKAWREDSAYRTQPQPRHGLPLVANPSQSLRAS